MNAERRIAFIKDEMGQLNNIYHTQSLLKENGVCGNGLNCLVMVIFSTIYLSSVSEVVHADVFSTDIFLILEMPVCHQRTALFCIYKNCAKSQIDNAI